MARVLCKIPGPPEPISGVWFADHPSGRLSDPITDEEATRFASIPGYVLWPEPGLSASEPDAGHYVADSPPDVVARRRGRPPKVAATEETA